MSEHIPTFAEEVERKTIETVESLIVRHRMGLINDAQLYEGTNTAWEMTSGLLSKDLVALLSDAIPSESFVNHQVFAKGEGGKGIILSHNPQSGQLEILTVEVKERKIVSHGDDLEHTAEMLQTLRKRLKENEWQEL